MSARLAAVAVLVLALALGGCGAGHGGFRPTLGEPKASGVLVYEPPPGGRFDYIVYLPNATREREERTGRLAEVRRRMAERCRVADVTELYAHDVGTWPDGRPRTYYAVGVRCEPPPDAGTP